MALWNPQDMNWCDACNGYHHGDPCTKYDRFVYFWQCLGSAVAHPAPASRLDELMKALDDVPDAAVADVRLTQEQVDALLAGD